MNTTIETGPAPVSGYLAEIRREWERAGIIPANAPSAALEARREATPDEARARVRKHRPQQFRRKIDRALLPCILAAWDEADGWNGSHPGVWIWSHETGMAKTRMLWRQFGRLYVEHGRNILKISGQALAEQYFSYHMEGNPRSFYRWAMGFDVVMIDDLDKMDLADKRAPRMVRELFDEFYSHMKPVFVTANEPIEHFQKRIGESMARRIRDTCKEIQFYPAT
jgi:hypothetical protein